MKILITGATGNIGIALIRSLSCRNDEKNEIIAAVRNVDQAKKKIPQEYIDFRVFDFDDPSTHTSALMNIDLLFLLRPPQIANIRKYFTPLMELAKKENVQHIVFLSVQGAEEITFIPHHKIEKLNVDSRIPYTFIRPSYFMQNLSTTLKDDLEEGLIYLPAGKALFNYIDVLDIAEFTATVIGNPASHQEKAYTLTGNNNYSFYDVAHLLHENAGKQVTYKAVNPFSFLLRQIVKKRSPGQSFVILMLHFMQRFQKEADITDGFERIM